MADKSLLDRFLALPKWVQVAAGVLLVGGLSFGVYLSLFGGGKAPEQEEVPKTVIIDMPDAAAANYDRSRIDAYREGEFVDRMSSNPVDDYWNSLGEGLVSQSAGESAADSAIEGPEYSDLERYYIRNGIKTKAQVDREHEESRRKMNDLENRMFGDGSVFAAYKPMTQAQIDSANYARMEQALELAMRYQEQPDAPADAPEPDVPAEEERTLDLGGNSVLPTDSFGSDGIISSLDAPEDGGVVHYSGGTARKPVKATFLKTEKLSEGQRVIIRLMQDLYLSDGTMIPANTHITGTCSFGTRLKIHVTMLHYGGRMFPTDISVYDNDGTEGIYCPSVEQKKKAVQKAKEVAGSALSAVGSAVAGYVGMSGGMGGQVLSNVATSGVGAVSSSLNSDGSRSVSVSAGYEFYVYENVKESK